MVGLHSWLTVNDTQGVRKQIDKSRLPYLEGYSGSRRPNHESCLLNPRSYRPKLRTETVSNRHTEIRSRREKGGVKGVNTLPQIMSWVKNPNIPPNLLNNIHFVTLGSDRDREREVYICVYTYVCIFIYIKHTCDTVYKYIHT